MDSPQAPEKLAYTIKEACHALGISKAQFYKQVRKGAISTFPWAGRTLVRVETLRAALDRAEAAPEPSKRQRGGKPSLRRRRSPGTPPNRP